MKKGISISLIIVLCMVLLTSGAWAKEKSASGQEKKTEKAATAVITEDTAINEENVVAENQNEEAVTGEQARNLGQAKKAEKEVIKEGTANEAKNQGQAKKLEERIKVRGMNLKFDVPPVIKEGRTLIPVRAIMNGLGAEVAWNAETKLVTISRDDKVIVLDLEKGEATVNGEAVELDVPAQIISNRTFVPLRFIAQTLGDKVDYDEASGEINIGDEDTEEDEDVDEEDADEDADADVDEDADDDADEETIDTNTAA